MLRQFSNRVSLIRHILFYTLLFMASCKHERKEVDVSQVNINIHALRFEKDLAENSDNLFGLKEKYGNFFDLYTYQILKFGTADTQLLKTRLQDFVHDPDITNISGDAKNIYRDFTATDLELTDAFRHYKYYFPEKPIPGVVTFISGFNYAIVSADSTLGIGIDMYLGSDSKYYPSLEMPAYKIRKMRKEYITTDAMRGWGQSEWEQDPMQTDLLSQMIYLGKIQYFIDRMMPDVSDTIKFGFTAAQLQWCEMSEKATWSFFIDHKLLFSSEPSQIGKFVNDGPTTNGFPKESPGNIGAWIGFRIVKAYMDKFDKVTLSQLMEEKDAKKIFRESNYKPAK
jgi:gliding motility-associated lipoprotein GldB